MGPLVTNLLRFHVKNKGFSGNELRFRNSSPIQVESVVLVQYVLYEWRHEYRVPVLRTSTVQVRTVLSTRTCTSRPSSTVNLLQYAPIKSRSFELPHSTSSTALVRTGTDSVYILLHPTFVKIFEVNSYIITYP